MEEEGRGRFMVSFLVSELIGQPVQSFIETISTSGTGCLDVPVPVAKRMQSEFVCDFRCIHGVRQVLREATTVNPCSAQPSFRALQDSQELSENFDTRAVSPTLTKASKV